MNGNLAVGVQPLRKENCSKDGAQKKSNLSLGQQLAVKSLGKKIAKAEIMVLEADKCKRFVVVDEPTYIAMASDHTHKDIQVTREEVRTAQRVLSSTEKSMVNMMGTGASQSQRNYVHCMDNAGSEAEDMPTMKILPKVHKGPTSQGHPQSRPVVTVASGISSHAGDVLSDLIEPLVNMLTPRMEERSTEEVLSQLEEAKAAIHQAGAQDVMVGSLDVAALYSSLNQEQAAEMVSRMIEESPARLDGFDLRMAQVYLASNMTTDQIKREGLSGLLPVRVGKRGNRPGPTTEEL